MSETAATEPSTTTLSAPAAPSAATAALDDLLAAGINTAKPPAYLVAIYQAAARRYHLDWTVLAAINAIETDYGSDVHTSSAGAIGWMQFEPATWHRYAVDASGTGTPNPDNPRDAIFSAARYLEASGGARHLRQAIFAYNHDTWYVTEVLWLSARIGDTRPAATVRTKLAAMRATATALDGLPYVWGGGHGGWTLSDGYDCSGFVSAVLHAAGYLSTPVTTQALAAQPGIVRGPGRWVTIFDRTDASAITGDHVIVDIDGQWWESGGDSADGGGAGVHRIAQVSRGYLETFNLVLHPRSL